MLLANAALSTNRVQGPNKQLRPYSSINFLSKEHSITSPLVFFSRVAGVVCCCISQRRSSLSLAPRSRCGICVVDREITVDAMPAFLCERARIRRIRPSTLSLSLPVTQQQHWLKIEHAYQHHTAHALPRGEPSASERYEDGE